MGEKIEPAADFTRFGKRIGTEGVEGHIRLGIALGGAAISATVIAFVLKRLGVALVPEHPTVLELAQRLTFLVAFLNLGAWSLR